jgi:hypothetical protein
MHKLVRLSLLTLALAASALSFSPRNVFAACDDDDIMVRPGRCCADGSRSYTEFICVNGAWRAQTTFCSGVC